MNKETVLYVFEHRVTGKRYLGKTSQDVNKYYGSGVRWLNHLNKHGYNINRVAVSEPFTDEADIREFAELVSQELDVVKSERYLNLCEENGVGGNTTTGRPGLRNRKQSEESNRKRSITMKGVPKKNKENYGFYGSNNGRARPLIFRDVKYGAISECMKATNMSREQIIYRINRKKEGQFL